MNQRRPDPSAGGGPELMPPCCRLEAEITTAETESRRRREALVAELTNS
jgi:hypothetical protein